MPTHLSDLALDQLTIVDAAPAELIEIAHDTGFGGVGLFLHSMQELPLMAPYDLVEDRKARADVRRMAKDTGVGIDLVYPFTLLPESEVIAFEPALECAAQMEAKCLNLLIFDNDANRRADNLSEFVTLATRFGLVTAIEFYPLSTVRSLEEASRLLDAFDEADAVGINLDLLHHYRSHGTLDQLGSLPPERIAFAQLCDGPVALDRSQWHREAGSARQLPGEGEFDIWGFLAVLPDTCRLSIEVPDDTSCIEGVGKRERARRAAESMMRFSCPS